MRYGRTLAIMTGLMLLSTQAFAQSTAPADPSAVNGNPAAAGHGEHKDATGTHVPGAMGTNAYSGKSVGVPLAPNDLGSPQQNAKEK